MSAQGTIQHLKHNQINRQLWDACIDQSGNGLIYAYSVYLEHVADNWDALVLNNYEAVMPLPWRKKYDIHYLYQPFLTAQLGLFGNNLTAELLERFLKAIPSQFKLWELPFNHQNLFSLKDFHLYERMNYVLYLGQPYENIWNNYRENLKRNIKKSIQYGCYIKTGIPADSVIELAKLQTKNASPGDFENFKKLMAKLRAKTYGVFSNKDELIASCTFTFSHKRAYYILVGNHPNGRTLGASHALIDAFIKDHAGQDLLLDFEGSDIRNLAFFYSSYGAKEEKYSAIKLNRLPWYVKWMKK